MNHKRNGPSRYYVRTHAQIMAEKKANERQRLCEELDTHAAKANRDAAANARPKSNHAPPPNLANQPVEELFTLRGKRGEDADWIGDHLWSE